MIPRVNVDCDGVLADFDKAAKKLFGIPARQFEDQFGSDVFWSAIRGQDRFYYRLDLMPGAVELMAGLAPYDPWILTGSPATVPEAHLDKQDWVARRFGPTQPVITCKSKDKSNFCRPGDVIIDDWPKHKDLWIAKGGHWIDYVGDVEDTLAQVHRYFAAWVKGAA